ncbi:hypothetical protein [Chitiniphilus shinanonensis]|uniref:hypothetical protein n=1 Tax=Chitiniphilus shinanonensis TaxID=553088 RepID=UPI00302BB480
MSSAEARLYLCGQGVVWRDGARRGAAVAQGRVEFDLPWRWGTEDGAQQLEAVLDPILTSLVAAKVQVLLATDLVQWLALPWSPALVAARAARAQCRMRLLDLWGGARAASALCEPDETGFGRARSAACLELALCKLLIESCARHGKRLSALRPLAIDAWHAVRSQLDQAPHALAVVEPGVLSLFVWERRHPRFVATQPWQDDWQGPLELLWHRCRVRGLESLPLHVLSVPGVAVAPSGGGPGKRLRWPGADDLFAVPIRPGCWPEFSSEAPRVGGARALLLACGMAAAAWGGWAWWSANHEWAAARQALAQAQPQARARPVAAVGDDKPLRLRIDGVNRLIAQLNLPYAALMASLAPPQGLDVALREVTFRHGDGAGAIRLTVSSRSTHDMTAYYAHLLKQPQLRGVRLIKHELARGTTPPRLDFELEATWR